MNRLLIRLWGVVEGEDAASINYQIAQTLIQNSASIRHTLMTALADFHGLNGREQELLYEVDPYSSFCALEAVKSL